MRDRTVSIIVASACIALSAGSVLAADPTPTPLPSSPAQAPTIGLGVGATQLVLNADATSGSFIVANAGTAEMQATATAFDFVINSDGTKEPTTDPVPLGAASWLTIEPAAFTMPSSGEQKVTFTVDIPKDATPGDHYAGINVVGTMSDEAWADVQAQSQGGSVFRSKAAIAETVIVRVPGEIKNDLAGTATTGGADPLIPSFVATFGGDVTFNPEIVNHGNVAAIWRPTAEQLSSTGGVLAALPTLRLTSRIGLLAKDELLVEGKPAPDGSFSVTPITVLPGSTYVQSFVLKDPPILGMYDYTYTLPGSEADGRETVTYTGSTTIVNTQKVLLWIVLPIVVILLLIIAFFAWRRLRKRRARLAKERKAQELAQAREEGRREAMAAQATAPVTGAPATPPRSDADLQAAVAAEEARQAAIDGEGKQ